ncbi:MAG: M48 family metalloprotease, partial [Candidatus Omnitrophica bacterium]|nr:M48 family metalloprotease [Candidatus Omnitrophota bacterium]
YANVYQNNNNVFVVGSALDVLIEEDYLALESTQQSGHITKETLTDEQTKAVSQISTSLIKEILIPEIKREVNEGEIFANLRQIYNSLILAVWFKQNLKNSLLGEQYADQGKVTGIDFTDKQANQKIYDQYLEAFKKGAYNFIKEDYDERTQQIIPRKYFSGGVDVARTNQKTHTVRDPKNLGDLLVMSKKSTVNFMGAKFTPIQTGQSPTINPDDNFFNAFSFAKQDGGDIQKRRERSRFDSEHYLFLQAQFGFLPQNHEAVQFVEERLQRIMPGIPFEDLPDVRILARKGYGINAWVYPNGLVIVTPELLEFIEYAEELDGVLLHELNHTSRQHFEIMRKNAKGSSILKYIGFNRYAEYEADIMAFYQMQERDRETTPQGYIRFMEHLRDYMEGFKKNDPTQNIHWDMAHGNLSDRILKLKMMSRALDMLNLEQELTLFPKNIASQLNKLSSGGKLNKIFDRSRFYGGTKTENWLEEMDEMFTNANWSFYQMVLKSYYQEFVEFEEQNVKLQQFNKRILKKIIQEWKDGFERNFQHIDGALKKFVQAILLESGAEIPVISDPKNPIFDHLPELKEFTKAVKYDGSKRLIPKITKLIPQLLKVETMQLSHQSLSNLVSTSVYQAFYENMEYEDQTTDEIDLDQLFEDVTALIIALDHFTSQRGFTPIGHSAQFSLSESWLGVISVVLLSLEDLHMNEKFKDVKRSAEKILFNIDTTTRAKLFSIKKNYTLNSEVFSHLKTFFPLTFQSSSVENELKESWNPQMIFNLLKEKKELDELIQETEKLKRGQQEKIIRNLEKMAEIISDLPDKFNDENGEEVSRSEFITRVLVGVYFANRTLYVQWVQRVTKTEAEYVKALNLNKHYFYNITEDEELESYTLENLNQLADLIAFPGGQENLFGLSQIDDVDYRLENQPEWQQIAFVLLAKKLKNITQDNMYVKTIQGFLQRWPVASSTIMDDRGIKESGNDYYQYFDYAKREVINHFIKIIEDAKKSKNNSQTVTNLIYILSLLVGNLTLQRPLQEYILKDMLSEADFNEMYQTVFENFSAQGVKGGGETLVSLDQKAESAEQMDKITQTWETMRSRKVTNPMDTIGSAVIADGMFEYFLDRIEPLNLLISLLESKNDDYNLTVYLINSWWKTYSSLLMSHLVSSIYDLYYDNTDISMDEFLEKMNEMNFAELSEKLFNHDSPWRSIVSITKIRDTIYRLGAIGRAFIVRKLLTGKNGILHKPEKRAELFEYLFSNNISRDDDLYGLMRQVYSAVFETATADELYLMIHKIIETQIAYAPNESQPLDNAIIMEVIYHDLENILMNHDVYEIVTGIVEKEINERTELGQDSQPTADEEEDGSDYLYETSEAEEYGIGSIYVDYRDDEPDDDGIDEERAIISDKVEGAIKENFEKHILFYIRESLDMEDKMIEEKIIKLVPEAFNRTDAKKFSPIEFIINTAEQLGAPGVRL